MSRIATTLFAGLLAVSSAACSIDVARNDDGSLQVDSSISEESMNAEVALALEDSAMTDVRVDLTDVYMQVTGFLPHPDDTGGDAIEFRVDLGVVDGHLTAVVSEATAAGRTISEEVLARWNDRLAERLEHVASRHPNSTLQSVTIEDGSARFSWRIETPRSR